MSYQFINFNIQDHIARIIFNRPEVYNSIHQAMAFEIQNALELCKSHEVRCVVVPRPNSLVFQRRRSKVSPQG